MTSSTEGLALTFQCVRLARKATDVIVTSVLCPLARAFFFLSLLNDVLGQRVRRGNSETWH